MTPPGLGLVAAGPRAIQAHQLAGLRTAYWDWTKRDGALHYQKYCGTPPEHLLFGLRQAIDMLFEEGLEAVYRRHHLLAEATRRAVAVWAEGGVLAFNVLEPAARANSVTTVRIDGTDPQRLRDYCRSEEHTSELQSLMRISYAVFCLKKKKTNNHTIHRKT